jgi:hypothetical protein
MRNRMNRGGRHRSTTPPLPVEETAITSTIDSRGGAPLWAIRGRVGAPRSLHSRPFPNNFNKLLKYGASPTDINHMNNPATTNPAEMITVLVGSTFYTGTLIERTDTLARVRIDGPLGAVEGVEVR